MNYYKLTVHPPIVGAEGHFKFKAENQKEADELAYEISVSYTDGYVDKEEEEEESGIEMEYDYVLEEIDQEEYNELDYDNPL